GHTPGVFKRGKDTEWDANHGMEEIREFCFKEFAAVCLFWNFFVLWLLIILLIKAKCDMLIAAVPFLERNVQTSCMESLPGGYSY
ncbi:hypothetical protein, partial [Roseburia hominis]|uniref:hypothetical protein n=1 Tax=Roseburia hominis TaxID=301301 RepID=UPI0026652574